MVTDSRTATGSGVQPVFDVNGNQTIYVNYDLDGDGVADQSTQEDQSGVDYFNWENQLAQAQRFINNVATSINVFYDGDGNRIVKSVGATTSTFLVDDRNPTGYAQVLEETLFPVARGSWQNGHWAFNEGAGNIASDISRACFPSGFASDLELAGAETRREEGAYSLKSVTDKQRSIGPSQPKDDGECTWKTRLCQGHHGAIQSGVTWAAGKVGSALQFGATSGGVQIPDAAGLRQAGSPTLAFWMQTSSTPSAAARLVGKGTSANENYGVWTTANDSHLYFGYVNTSGVLQRVSSLTSFTPGVWYHVAVSLSATSGAGNVQFYVNGTGETSAPGVTGLPTTSTDLLTFGYAGYGAAFTGMLDEVYLYSTSVSAGPLYINTLSATTGTGLICRYNAGLNLIGQERLASGTWNSSYYGYDGLGSVRVLYDATGNATDTYSYDAFGNLQESSGSTLNYYRFAGQQWDPDIKLYYNRARYLNPDTGRFTTRDTWEGSLDDPASLHRYLYASANPVAIVDPTGHFFEGISGLLVGMSQRFAAWSMAGSVAAKSFGVAISVLNVVAFISDPAAYISMGPAGAPDILAADVTTLARAGGGLFRATRSGLAARNAFRILSGWRVDLSLPQVGQPGGDEVTTALLEIHDSMWIGSRFHGKSPNDPSTLSPLLKGTSRNPKFSVLFL
jgi:RHS repeat-associated protein